MHGIYTPGLQLFLVEVRSWEDFGLTEHVHAGASEATKSL